MSASISSRSTKAQLLAHIATVECELRQARKELEGQRMLTSIAEGNAALARAAVPAPTPAPVADDCEAATAGRFAPIDVIATRPVRTFMSQGVLCHRVQIGFNRYAIRAVVAQ